MTASSIPVFSSLYGEIDPSQLPDSLHSERLEQRSGFHDWKIKPHRHDQLVQIFIVVEGGGEAVIDGQSVQFVAPYIAFVPSLTVHSFQYFADSSGFVLSVFKDEIQHCLSGLVNFNAAFKQPFSVFKGEHKQQIESTSKLVNDFHREYRASKPGRLLALRSLLTLILVSLNRCVPKPQENSSTTDPNKQQYATTLLELIEENYTEQHGIQFYASQMNVTASKLRQISKSMLGVSAHQLINNKIVLEAKRNILYTSMTASQIAHMLGFKDPAYFSRFFKKHTGESPSEYRRRT